MQFSKAKHLIIGEPLSDLMSLHERLPKWKALAVLSSDALSSVAYATEEILIVLSVVGAVAFTWSLPIALGIVALLVLVTLSYRQTIDAYPNGGGAYIVAKENLGTHAGLVAGASLMIDYVLTVAVSVAAGVENLTSAFPALRDHKVLIGVLVVFSLMLLNLRGVRESGSVFALPTYLFIASFALLIIVGIVKYVAGYAPVQVPIGDGVLPALPLFLVLRAFSSGCAALSGVEAISNGIPIFCNPTQKNAKKTLMWMSLILGTFFLSITLLAYLYGIVPHHGETAVSLLSRAVFGQSAAYYMVQASTSLILVLAANTAYADFPRLTSLLAKDRYLPRQLADVGDRLVFSNGIIGLSVAAMGLIMFFSGSTHQLIPLYAVGVFLSFTLSQSGMVLHHLRERAEGFRKALCLNLMGAVTTCLVLMVIAYTKFANGAFIVVILIPTVVYLFKKVHTHYLCVGKELSLADDCPESHCLTPLKHTVIVPVSGMHRGVLDALRYAISISSDVRACYIELDHEAADRMRGEWSRWAKTIPLVILQSPYRSVVSPLLDYIDKVGKEGKDDLVTVLIPEFVTTKWWHQLLHHHTALLIRIALLFKPRKVVTSVRYHLH
jgi:amino acid transporter